MVTSQLNERILEDIASAGKGSFLRFNNKPSNFRNIINEIDAMEKRTLKSHIYSDYEDQYQKFGICHGSIYPLDVCLLSWTTYHTWSIEGLHIV